MFVLGLSSGLNSGAVKGIEKDSLWKETVVPRLEGRAPCEPFRVVLCYQGFGDNAKRDGVETERCLRLLRGNCTFLYFEFGRQDLEWTRHCDFFYMSGGQEDLVGDLFKEHGWALAQVGRLVRSGVVGYIGGCAGAMIAGQSWVAGTGSSRGVPLLGLLKANVGVGENHYKPRGSCCFVNLESPEGFLFVDVDGVMSASALWLSTSGRWKHDDRVRNLQIALEVASKTQASDWSQP